MNVVLQNLQLVLIGYILMTVIDSNIVILQTLYGWTNGSWELQRDDRK